MSNRLAVDQWGWAVIAAATGAYAVHNGSIPWLIPLAIGVGTVLVVAGLLLRWFGRQAEIEWHFGTYASAAGDYLNAIEADGKLQVPTRLLEGDDDPYAVYLDLKATEHPTMVALAELYAQKEPPDVRAARQEMKRTYREWSRILRRPWWVRPPNFDKWFEQKIRRNHKHVFELWIYAECALADSLEHVERPDFEPFVPLINGWMRNRGWRYPMGTKEKEEEKMPGPDPERLKIEKEDWKEALKKALRKKKPKEGWPEEKEPQNERGQRK